jgi:hypothetical protein
MEITAILTHLLVKWFYVQPSACVISVQNFLREAPLDGFTRRVFSTPSINIP